MKTNLVVLALAACLLPISLFAHDDGHYNEESGWEESEGGEPEYGSLPLDEVWEVIASECVGDSHEEGECPEGEDGTDAPPMPPEEGTKDFQCALDVVEEMFYFGEICHDVYRKVKHQIQIEIAFSNGFREGFEKGREGAKCEPPEGGESESGSNEEEGSAEPKEKVVICHIPPGNPANAHTIEVGAPAVQAHLNHGDVLGSCEDDSGDKGKGKKGKGKRGKKKGKKKRGKKK